MSVQKTRITRIPIDRKFIEELLARDQEDRQDYLEITHDYPPASTAETASDASVITAASGRPKSSIDDTDESFHR